MPAHIEMPKLSDTMTEGKVVKWRKKVGDPVEIGDVLAEIETDKAVMDMEAFDEGVLGKILVKEGESAAVGQKLAEFSSDSGDNDFEEGAETGTASAAQMEKSSPAEKAEKSSQATPPPKSQEQAGKRVKASPLAKKIATQNKVDLASVQGSGPAGRIVARDVEQASGGPAPKASSAGRPAPATAPRAAQAAQTERRIPLSSIRKTIADRLLAAKQQIPHFYLHVEVDMGELLQLRVMLNKAAEQHQLGKITINDFILKAVAMAASRVPQVNASFNGNEIIEYGNVDLAVAVAIDEGLITPVIRAAQNRSLRDISETIRDLAERARQRKLKLDEFQGGTLTVSNLGSYGIEAFDAIVNPPQALILSVGAVVKKPVVNAENQVVVAHRMDIGISADHRVVDGAVGAQFLAELRKVLEAPAVMLL